MREIQTTVAGARWALVIAVAAALAVLWLPSGARAATGTLTFSSCLSEGGSGGCGAASGLSGQHGLVVSPDGTDVYAVGKSSTTGQVAELRRDPSSGTLTETGCVAEDGADGCAAGQGLTGAAGIAISPDGRDVYVASDTSNAVVAFARNPSTGALSEIGCIAETGVDGCTPAAGLSAATGIAVSPDGANVYATSETSDAVVAFSRNASSGALTWQGCTAHGGAEGCAAAPGLGEAENVIVSPDDATVYVTGFTTDSVATFDRNATSGALTFAGCVAEGGADGCVAGHGLDGADGLAVSGASLYVAAEGSGAVATFARGAAGILTEQGCVAETVGDTCGEVRGLSGTARVAVSGDGDSVYAAGYRGNTLVTFARAGSGTLTAQSPCLGASGNADGCTVVAGLTAPAGLAVSPDGADVYAGAATSNAVDTFLRQAPASGAGPAAPAVATGSATASRTAATVTGTVDPNGAATTYHFDYGTTSGYGHSTSNQSAGAGSSAVAVTAAITGLSADTTYHYRLVAVNAGGTVDGSGGAFTTGGTYSQAILADHPVSYWRLGERSGTTAADSAGTHPGTYTGGYTLGTPGALAGDPDTAVTLNGSSGYVNVPFTAALNPAGSFSVQAWVKPASYRRSDDMSIVDSRPSSAAVHRGYDLGLEEGDGRPYIEIGTGRTYVAIVAAQAVPKHRFTDLVATYDGMRVRLYENGDLVAGPTRVALARNRRTPLNLGDLDHGAGQFLDGSIDEAAIYRTALSAAAVAHDHAVGTGGSAATSHRAVSWRVLATASGTIRPGRSRSVTACSRRADVAMSDDLSLSPPAPRGGRLVIVGRVDRDVRFRASGLVVRRRPDCARGGFRRVRATVTVHGRRFSIVIERDLPGVYGVSLRR
ncbi:MAG: beta-propeller fold lactonase family protein [Solirubrobacterales bacterium]|nr:beta-propeller fold lactonase family protein [Solirubrobacterales bacterium]